MSVIRHIITQTIYIYSKWFAYACIKLKLNTNTKKWTYLSGNASV